MKPSILLNSLHKTLSWDIFLSKKIQLTIEPNQIVPLILRYFESNYIIFNSEIFIDHNFIDHANSNIVCAPYYCSVYKITIIKIMKSVKTNMPEWTDTVSFHSLHSVVRLQKLLPNHKTHVV